MLGCTPAFGHQPLAVSRTQQARELGLRYSILRHLLPVHEQHRNLETVARLEIPVGRDVDFLERDRERPVARHAREYRFHVVAEVAAWFRVEGERDHAADVAPPRADTS